MAKLHRDHIIVKHSPVHGLGVFAERDFAPDEVIEACYTLKCSNEDSHLRDYRFGKDDGFFLPLGYGCIYNHADAPNAHHKYDENKNTLTMTVARPIKKGEEIFISYGRKWFEDRDCIVVEPTLKGRIIKKMQLYMPFFMRLLKALTIVIALMMFVNMFAYVARVFYLS